MTAAPARPATGPLPSRCRAVVRLGEATPPMLRATSSGLRQPRARSRSPRSMTCSSVSGARKALRMVVMLRRYSSRRGATSDDSSTGQRPNTRVRVLAAHELGHLPFVGRVHERPGEAHRDGPRSLTHKVVDRGQHVVGAQRHEHFAEAVDALTHTHPQRPGHQIVGPLGPGAVDLHLPGACRRPTSGSGPRGRCPPGRRW